MLPLAGRDRVLGTSKAAAYFRVRAKTVTSVFAAGCIAGGHTYVQAVIKQTVLAGVLVLLIAFFFTSCASDTDETLLAKPSVSQSEGTTVPGEKMGDDDRVTPGAMGSTNVHW